MSIAPTVAARGGKYLTFYLGGEEYGVAILRVQEIISMQSITRVPRTPAFMRGVINLRGRVIPIVGLRERFGMPAADAQAEDDAQAVAAAAVRCIIVVEVQVPDDAATGTGARRVPMGVIVDRVSEVAALDEADVEDPPSFGAGVRTDFLLGIAMSKGAEQAGAAAGGGEGPRAAADAGRVRLLLDIDRVLATAELAELASVVA